MNFALVNPRVWLEIAVSAALAWAGWYAYNWVYDRGAASVQVQWDAERLEVAKQSAKVSADALATTKTLQTSMDTQRSQTNAQITALNASLAGAIAGLRERPARDSQGGVPRDTATGAAIGATGADLLRDDAAVLVREAGRADRLRIQLGECQAAYQRAREAIN